MFDTYDPSPSEVRQTMALLRERNVATVTLEFSGGNDEGGVDSITYLDATGNEVKDVPQGNAHEDRYYSGGREHNDGWVVYDRSLSDNWQEQKRPATPDEIKWSRVDKVLSAPIYARYYTFAGEFYVQGTLSWDVAAGTHEMHGQESYEVWEDF